MFNFKAIENILEYPYKYEASLAPILVYFLVFYGGNAAPKLPNLILSLFENPVFRIFILSLIVYKGNSNPSTAILIAVGFTLVMDRINKQNFSEEFSNHIEKFSNKLEEDNEIIDNDTSPKELESDNLENNDDFAKEDTCDGMCSKIDYNQFEGKIKSDEFSQEYYNTIKDCMVVDLLQNKSNNEVNKILKKMDLTHNDIDGPIGTAYVNYTDAVSRLNL